MTEWRSRYRGYGVLVYWYVETNAVCIYSQLRNFSFSEVAAMSEGLIRHDTEMRVEKNFVDSHGQSEVAFAFCLMPRLKRLKYERPYLPDKGLAGACPNLAGVTTNANAGQRWLSRNPPDLAEARACLQRIIRDGNRASEVIARVHALAKRSTPPKARLDLRDTIPEVLALIEPEARRHGVAVHTDLAADLPLVRADRVQLQQVLLNLVLNGLDAMQAVTDRPCVSRIRAQPHAAGHVLVAVQDAGIGLDPQSVARRFEPFYTTKPEGMGLGLAISRSIIEQHGGRLWVTPNDGPGATVQFTLPAADGQQQE
jgi:signal transduction histidine kinase